MTFESQPSLFALKFAQVQLMTPKGLNDTNDANDETLMPILCKGTGRVVACYVDVILEVQRLCENIREWSNKNINKNVRLFTHLQHTLNRENGFFCYLSIYQYLRLLILNTLIQFFQRV